MNITPRYSVCIPAEPYPIEVRATTSRAEALADETRGAVVYDWTTGKVVTE